MIPIALKPRKALNKAFLKLKPGRPEIDSFKASLGLSRVCIASLDFISYINLTSP